VAQRSRQTRQAAGPTPHATRQGRPGVTTACPSRTHRPATDLNFAGGHHRGEGSGEHSVEPGAEDQYTFYHDQAGNLTRFTDHMNWSPAQWVNPQSGTALPYTQVDNYDNQLAVPGDFGTTTTTHTGEAIFKPAHNRTIFLNAGRYVFSPDGLDFRAGPQSFLNLFVDGDLSVLEPLCAAMQ
jgi:hypothetical protein